MRRLRAMLENLSRALPESRWPALHKELDLLDQTVAQLNPLADDLVLARTPDPQGLGWSFAVETINSRRSAQDGTAGRH